ncbi:MAG: hypothetical protein NC906_04465, partial [Candidatus Omnitrophica bacterium]|nr:hypothetical protein [Candidatus Omnitrophota bacterium]
LGYNEKTCKYLMDNIFRANLRLILVLHLMEVGDKVEIAKAMIHCYGRYPSFWFIHLPFLFIPISVFRLLRKIRKAFKKKLRSS